MIQKDSEELERQMTEKYSFTKIILLLDQKKLLIATSLIFETKKDNRGVTAINARPPSSYEDFQLILSYLKTNPSISTEVTITGQSRWGE